MVYSRLSHDFVGCCHLLAPEIFHRQSDGVRSLGEIIAFHSGDNVYPFQAFKYCNDPFFPKPETTVIFSSIRAIAKVVGLFFAAPLIEVSPPGRRLNYFKSIPAVIALIAIQYQFVLYTPKQFKLLIFYAYTFAVYSTFQYLFLATIPKYCAHKVEKPKAN